MNGKLPGQRALQAWISFELCQKEVSAAQMISIRRAAKIEINYQRLAKQKSSGSRSQLPLSRLRVSLFWFASNRREPAFPVSFTICKWGPKAYQVRKALSLLAFAGWHDARGRDLGHDDANDQLCGAPKMNTRETIQILKRRIKPMAMMLGASSLVRTRAFGEGPDRAAVRTLRQVRAFRRARV
jgi:hypothetical protein